MHYILVFWTNAASRNAQYCLLLFICIAYKTSNHLLNLSHTAPFKKSFMLLYIYLFHDIARHDIYQTRPEIYQTRPDIYQTRHGIHQAHLDIPNAYQIQIVSTSSLIIHHYCKRLVKHHNVFFVNDEQCEFANKKSHISYTAHNFQN